MKRKNIGILITLFATVLFNVSSFAQTATSLMINEVMVNNTENFVDDYGQRSGWIEIFNPTYATVNIRNCYITTDKSVLDKNLSVPERVAKMYVIPKGDVLTKIAPRQHLLFWADGQATKGNFHTNFTLDTTKENWIGLYDANGYTLIDSITVPKMAANCSYAMNVDGVKESGFNVKGAGNGYVTPNTNNKTLDTNDKINSFKKHDPIGLGMAVMAMLVVFCGLLLLFISFKIVGVIALRLAKRNAMIAKGTNDPKEVELAGEESGEVFAAISMALHQSQSTVHDIEETILTINRVKRNYSPWNSKIYTLRKNPRR